ncbi:glucosaminidase domain-containing protein [Neobacillus sp. FSL H8-0543]|uniref:glucosaminidase domain-containing protein n=1 Tax=Neobacillus sp. FSL H8-0543 TaxID=2954672 RepID=UPI0031597817
MSRIVFRSFLLAFLFLGVFTSNGLAEETVQNTQMSVTSIKLPVYRNFEELSDHRIHLADGYDWLAELSFNDKITVLSEKEYAAKIMMQDGTIGWVHKDYLRNSVMNQTWLVKEWRNLREGPGTSYPIKRQVPDQSKVIVLDYHKAANYYKIQTEDGEQGWIYGFYQGEKNGEFIDYRAGSNVIPYDFESEGKVTNKITIFTPLNTLSTITANQINQFINYKTKGNESLMKDRGSAYIEAQKVTGLNAVYLLAHSGVESKWGTSDIVKNKNNFYGIGAVDSQPGEGANQFPTPEEGIIKGATWIKENYVSRNQSIVDFPIPQPTLDNMRFNSNLHQYSTDEAWAGKIAFIAKEFYDFTFARGWQFIDSKWYFFNNDGTNKTNWLLDNGKWYYLDQSGVMLTGWQFINGKWYFLNQAGDMKTGWLYSGGKWYFLNQNGDMKTGWLSSGGKWYFLNQNGDMKTGWLPSGGKWYFLNSAGDMKTGWFDTGGKWYFLDTSGAMLTGWKISGGKWYYLYSDGSMAKNTTINGYKLNGSGAWIQ